MKKNNGAVKITKEEMVIRLARARGIAVQSVTLEAEPEQRREWVFTNRPDRDAAFKEAFRLFKENKYAANGKLEPNEESLAADRKGMLADEVERSLGNIVSEAERIATKMLRIVAEAEEIGTAMTLNSLGELQSSGVGFDVEVGKFMTLRKMWEFIYGEIKVEQKK